MKTLICVVCPVGCKLTAIKEGDSWNIDGNKCSRGLEFAIEEMTIPKRTISTTVKTNFKKIPYLPVKTDKAIPKELIFPLIKLISGLVIKEPVKGGEIIVENVFGTGVNVISTLDLKFLLEGEFNE